uniref:uncharacterized protein LOC120329906 n=1 Tax=Styela clava TaxID=7725 RepID=UPI001939AD7C|nr:uncharacterized protein LOC120329906 [Styela clava]
MELTKLLFCLFSLWIFTDCYASVDDEKCGMTPRADIDWKKVPTFWYLSYYSPNPIFSEVVSCQASYLYKIVDEGPESYAVFHGKDYYYNGNTPEQYELSFKHAGQGPGLYYWTSANNSIVDAGSKVSSTRSYNKERTELEEMEMQIAVDVMATDYSTYLIDISCNKHTGEKQIVLVFTTNPDPTAEEFLNVRRALIDLNVTETLAATQCASSPAIADFAKLKM